MRLNQPLRSSLAILGLASCLCAPSALASVNIVVQPTNQVALVTSNATFSASVAPTAGETILGFAWLMSSNGMSPFFTIPGATTATCTITNVQTTNAGFYFVRVTYLSGGTTNTTASSAVELIVRDLAHIIAHPQPLIRAAGATASLSVTARGDLPIHYQWRRNGIHLADDARVSGATSNVLAIAGLDLADGGSYDVTVSNIYGGGISQEAALSVVVPPQNTSVILGSNAVLSAVTSGPVPLGFRWQKGSVPLSNGGRISGATSDTLTIASVITNDAGNYRVVVTNTLGSSFTSPNALLTVLIPPTINSPTNALGRQGLFFTYNATASGTPPITFGAEGLPAGLTIEPTNGVISGIPDVEGVFNVTLYATNPAIATWRELVITLTTGIPGITSSLVSTGQQGYPFAYTITASNDPVTFSTSVLPEGLSVDPTTGVISGVPQVFGEFQITVAAENKYGMGSNTLALTLITDVPAITSPLVANGQQGQVFSYTITASNDPVTFSATGLPLGLSFNPLTATISGPPVVNGSFPVTITASNQFGGDSQTLLLELASALPVITSPLTAFGAESATGFSYTITASNSPTAYGAVGLPLGLSVNTTNGVISGVPLYGGTFNVVISAENAWGTGSDTLTLNLDYAAITNLTIADVKRVYSKPYVLDFEFTLRDDPAPGAGNPVVRPISQLQVVCMEDGAPIPAETTFIADRGNKKQLKTYLALDYTFSMFVVPGAIDQMQEAAKTLINSQPGTAQFGIYEFHADYVDPQLVTSNGFTSDKEFLGQAIDGIQANYVKGEYAGTRAFDALHNAISQFGAWDPTNRDEQRYVVVMTDGNDDSSLLNTNADPIQVLVDLALTNNVRIFCVAFGPTINVGALQQLTSLTAGRYYEAATTADLPDQFLKIVKDIDGQYLLRWASLKRAPRLYQPSFQITLDGFTDAYNTTVMFQTNFVDIDTNSTPPVTNFAVTNISADYYPPDWAGDVKVGSLRFVADADVGPQTIRLRATYVPRFVRELKLGYRANYPCVASLNSSGPGEILSGWSMSETNDGTNGIILTLTSPDPTNLLTSIPYGAFGDLVTFRFLYPDLITGTQAFSAFTADNTIYSNILAGGQSFVFENATNFLTLYPQSPPFGTPIPWLIAYGFTNNFDLAELSDPNTNGMPVWQEYIAGLNPLDPNSIFSVQILDAPPIAPPQIIFSTVENRTYRLESAFSLDTWTVLRDRISGTGGTLMFTDLRDLSGVNAVFYRVAVY